MVANDCLRIWMAGSIIAHCSAGDGRGLCPRTRLTTSLRVTKLATDWNGRTHVSLEANLIR